jgi:hypothetical protein
MTNTEKIALITGATQGLGLALAEELAQRLNPGDTVYLTGRNDDRVKHAVEALGPTTARVRGEVLDVAEPDAARRLAEQLQHQHGAIDIVFSNAVMRSGPDDDPREVVDAYAKVNNFGATRVLRAFAPLLRDNARLIVVASLLGTLHYLVPVLHNRFDDLASLDDVDEQVAAWRDAVKDGSAPGPAEAAVSLLDRILQPLRPEQYGELLRGGHVLPWKPNSQPDSSNNEMSDSSTAPCTPASNNVHTRVDIERRKRDP